MSRINILIGLCVATGAVAQPAINPADTLAVQFRNPPTAVRPYVWWHWMGSNFSRSGITKDLEAMKTAGIGGATIFNLSSAVQESHTPTENNPWPEQTYRSPAYWDALKHAAAEAQRLGLEIGLHNTVGYSTTGGPWITEERAMQKLVWSKTETIGGNALTIMLPEPEKPIYTGWGSTRKPATLYRDVVVLAVPQQPNPSIGAVLNLSKYMDTTGRLTWQAPAGGWTVYRIGHSPTMANPHPMPDELIGKVLEVDKMSAEQTRFHWQNVLEPVKANLGPYLGQSFRHMLVDSYEAGNQTWTPGFQEEFLKRKGYDPTLWLLSFMLPGADDKDPAKRSFLESEGQTKRFRWDFADVVSQLYTENGWTIAKMMLHEAGLNLQFEPYTGPFDTPEGAAIADLPMGEFWTHGTGAIRAAVVAGARAAGKTIVGAEAFTGSPQDSRYTEDPAFLKRFADGAFASGVNRLILHHWVHQPFDDRYQPGMGMGWWGTHFSRHQTWAEPGKAFFAYLARCQLLLQQGNQPGDYLSVGTGEAGSDILSLHDFLRQEIVVQQGRIVLPSGRTYPFIAFQGIVEMLPEMARKIKTLVEAGATVVATKPTTSPGLTNFPACDDSLRAIVAEVWHTGRVLPTVAEAIRRFSITPDVSILSGPDTARVKIAHRQTDGGDIYFVVNQSARGQHLRLSFRVAGRQPELWQAEDGSTHPAPVWQANAGRTEVEIGLNATQSVFVVFRKAPNLGNHPVSVQVAGTTANWSVETNPKGLPVVRSHSGLSAQVAFASGKTKTINVKPAPPIVIDGPWEITFAPKLDSTFRRTFPVLTDFSQHSSPAVRYFTGTATYRKTITISHAMVKPGRRLVLDLGVMNNIAQVRLRDKPLGVLWYPPYQIDITDAVRTGQNQLDIAVTTNWANRLIGDEQEPADFDWGQDRGERGRAMKAYPDWFIRQQPRPSAGRKAFTIWYYYRKDSPLQPAGLVGPVRLVEVAERDLHR